MKISLSGYGEKVVTLEEDGKTVLGGVVKLTGNGKAGVCADGDKFCGVAVSSRGGYAAVQLSGYVSLPYTGAAPTVGWQALASNNNAGVQVKAGGRELLVTDVDTAAKCCGVIL